MQLKNNFVDLVSQFNSFERTKTRIFFNCANVLLQKPKNLKLVWVMTVSFTSFNKTTYFGHLAIFDGLMPNILFIARHFSNFNVLSSIKPIKAIEMILVNAYKNIFFLKLTHQVKWSCIQLFGKCNCKMRLWLFRC